MAYERPVFTSTTARLRDMLARNWFLPFTSFGGPAVHFQIFDKHFVEKHHWVDQQTYQEMFALCQALSGPGSTKMLYAFNVLRHGFWIGLLAFFIWSLPTAIAAYGLSLGVAEIGEDLPGPVYALLSGLNGATVGVIALAAVQLSKKAITDKVTRILVFFGAAAGMLYNALWYFPLLMVVGGCTTSLWDSRWGRDLVRKGRRTVRRRRQPQARNDVELGKERSGEEARSPTAQEVADPDATHRPGPTASGAVTGVAGRSREIDDVDVDPPTVRATGANEEEGSSARMFTWKIAISIFVAFGALFVTIMVLRGVLESPPRAFSIFANLFLAGTIIFGGGPVVIPLLREYVVAQGWVSTRDFLLGLAILQAFPGPNFNFAVYLGSLAAVSDPHTSSALGAFVAYVGIFAPGLTIHTSAMGMWNRLRRNHRGAVTSCLRGINASAVGLVYTAVYRLWQSGYLHRDYDNGRPLGDDAWWVVVTATSFTGGMWFGVSAPVAILLGGVMGMIWYGVVS